jgi:hypothetical protein
MKKLQQQEILIHLTAMDFEYASKAIEKERKIDERTEPPLATNKLERPLFMHVRSQHANCE